MALFLEKGKDYHNKIIFDKIWQKRRYYTWGLESAGGTPLDNSMPLLGEGLLCVFAGSEGSGKTTWSIEMAKQNAKLAEEDDYIVGYLSLEVDPYRLVSRYAERICGLTRFEVRDGITDEDRKQMLMAKSQGAIEDFLVTGLALFPKEEMPIITIEDIVAMCQEEYSPRLLFIDNLAEIGTKDVIRDEYIRYDYIMRMLLDVCRKTQTTIVLLHHLGKPKMGEKLTINSIKGNNIILTKADIVVAIDKHKEPNPNWKCDDVDEEGKPIDKKTLKAFMAEAPDIEVRQVEVFKDRDWDVRGVMGCLTIEDGIVKCLTKDELTERTTLLNKDKYLKALQRYNLISPL